jgi:hypothetical protein
MKFLVMIMFMFMSITSGVRAECPQPTMTEAALLDVVSTVAALGQGAQELNPLGLAGTTAIKGIMIAKQDSITPDQQATAAALWTGAGANNIMLTLGAAVYPAVLVGLITGLVVKFNNKC